jgi:endonuclease YncB( thermonuclease family)
MPESFRVIKGNFRVQGFKPDGDSVRFEANNIALFEGLLRDEKAHPSGGSFQLRLEGIDAPETHYGDEIQPLGDNSRDRLLDFLGFKDIKRTDEKIDSCVPAEMPGIVLSRSFDPHGRPIAYAIVGDRPELVDGSDIVVSNELLAQTLNAKMLQAGAAYPLLYTSTPEEHRAWLREQAQQARSKKLGVWAVDSSKEFALLDFGSICPPKGTLIYPKFFRRCVDYLHQVSEGGFRGDFTSWLQATPQENDNLLVNKREIPLSHVFEEKSNKVICQADLLDMVFVEKQ